MSDDQNDPPLTTPKYSALTLKSANNGGWTVYADRPNSPFKQVPIAAFSTTSDLLKGLEELLPKDAVKEPDPHRMEIIHDPKYGWIPKPMVVAFASDSSFPPSEIST